MTLTTSRALDHLLRATGDPIADLSPITPGQREFPRAQTLRAAVGVLAKVPDALPLVAQAIHAPEDLALSERERAHRAAAAAWLAGNPVLAAESYAFILARWPRDLLALRLAQSCYFFLGWHDRLCDIVDSVVHAWSRDRRGFGFLLAMASFAHAENGNTAHAEALGREALARDPACPLGVHAVAHAFAESGRHAGGAQWMREQRAHWATESRMCTHNAWHLAMFDIEEGDLASAVSILDHWLIPASAQSQLDACDAAALLWRLAGEGLDDDGRWRRVSDAFEKTVTPGFWPYIDLHAALAHGSAGHHARLARLVERIESRATGNDYAALRALHITLPGLRALTAWSQGRYHEAAITFSRIRPLLYRAGGSRVQLEIFSSIEAEAARRHERAERLPSRSTSTTERARTPREIEVIDAEFSDVRQARTRATRDEAPRATTLTTA
jgi:hypothetical protein